MADMARVKDWLCECGLVNHWWHRTCRACDTDRRESHEPVVPVG